MAGGRITKRAVDALAPRERDFIAWDDGIAGFGVRVRASGAKSYVVRYRAGSGRTAPMRQVHLGTVGKITPDEARKLAGKVLADVAHGRDPATVKAGDRRAATVGELIDTFMADHVRAKRKASTAGLYADILERLVRPALGTTKADKVTGQAVARLHSRLSATPYQANRTLAVLASLYAFAGRRGLVPKGCNPTDGIERFREEGRERFLTLAELDKLGAAIRDAETVGIPWRATDDGPTAKHRPKGDRRTVIGPHAAAALRLLLFTGARLREILHLKWEHVDIGRGLLFLPDSKTGKKTIVLSGPALAVLSNLKRVGDYVIAGEDPAAPRADLKRPWAVVSRQAGLEGVRLHDLRHTHASIGAGAGLGLPIIGKLLGHAQAATTARYAHLDADPLRRASDVISARIAAAMGEAGPSGDVVPLRRQA